MVQMVILIILSLAREIVLQETSGGKNLRKT